MKKHITLIGCGRWGLNILRDLKQLACKVTVIDPELYAQEQAKIKGASEVYSSLDAFFQTNASTDGFIIAASTRQHYSLLLSLKDVVQPIFVEKPMVLNTAETKHIMALMSDRVFVMHKWRYHPAVLELKRLVNNATFGKVKKISTIRHGLQYNYDIPGYLILLPHDLSIILELIGHLPMPTSVQKYLCDEKLIGFKAIFNFNPHIEISIKSAFSELQREVSIEFEQGTALFTEQDYQKILIFTREGKLFETIELDPIQPLFQELKSFLLYLSGSSAPKSCLNDELKIANCTEQLLQSTETSKDLTLCR